MSRRSKTNENRRKSSMQANKALNIFSSNPSTSSTQKRKSKSGEEKQSIKEAFNYKSLNESLLRKIAQLKTQIVQSDKCIERLRDENQELRIRNQKLTEATEEEKIELIVSQRVKSKLAHIAAINQRTVQFLQNAQTDLAEAMKEVEPEAKPNNLKKIKRKLVVEPSLDKVEESPIKRVSTSSDLQDDDDDDIVEIQHNDEEETPKSSYTESSNRKSRRSELFVNKENNTIEQETPKPVQPRRAPLCIAPEEDTSVNEAQFEQPKITERKKSKDKLNVTATPSKVASIEEGPTTIRRQRSAKMNVTSYKERPLGGKIRRPGKYDEKVPYIDNFFG